MDHLELSLHEPPSDAEREAEKLTEDSDLRWLIGDPRGRRIARRIFERTGIFRSSFTGEPVSTAFREGTREAGLVFLSKLMSAAPETTAKILAGQDGK